MGEVIDEGSDRGGGRERRREGEKGRDCSCSVPQNLHSKGENGEDESEEEQCTVPWVCVHPVRGRDSDWSTMDKTHVCTSSKTAARLAGFGERCPITGRFRFEHSFLSLRLPACLGLGLCRRQFCPCLFRRRLLRNPVWGPRANCSMLLAPAQTIQSHICQRREGGIEGETRRGSRDETVGGKAPPPICDGTAIP